MSGKSGRVKLTVALQPLLLAIFAPIHGEQTERMSLSVTLIMEN
ncbi:hypothetical protein [Cohaesibacter gelatinilyticus]|nr:hypothetical protein [Cohaesibacter gelatinilyticus]